VDFRHIALGRGPRHSERVFRAAISAFCSLARPTRNEIAQLDDLAMGLVDTMPVEARRFAAAALCECDPAPPNLVKRLCDEPVEIAAPLLVRSQALSDVDLIALIGRHGVPHARAIARRDNLNPVVAALIRALLARSDAGQAPPAASERGQTDGALEAVRDQLRSLMQDETPHASAAEERTVDWSPPPSGAYPDLREAAMSGDMRSLSEALARALDLAPARARSIVSGVVYSDLLLALKALDLSSEQAFLLTAAAYPAQVVHPAAIRLFHVRYEALKPETAREKVETWRQHERKGLSPSATGAHSLASKR
jgi:uncharacterized protein (DUF2336 family)